MQVFANGIKEPNLKISLSYMIFQGAFIISNLKKIWTLHHSIFTKRDVSIFTTFFQVHISRIH